jgi:pseudouridine synthase
MTNDGELTYRVTHPKFEIKKTYQAVVSGVVTDESLEKLRAGVQLSDGVTSPAEVRVLSRQGNSTSMEICITEGKKRQIRRMCSAVGHEVIELKRVATAGVVLRDVAPGKWRYLTPEEISQLRGPVSGSKDRDGSEQGR